MLIDFKMNNSNLAKGFLPVILIIFGMVVFSLDASAVDNMLSINSINLRVEYEPTNAFIVGDVKHYEEGISNSSSIKADVYPGSTVEFQINVANNFKISDDPDLKHVYASVLIDGIEEDGQDLEKESTSLTLEPQEDGRLYVKLDIPKKVGFTSYDVDINVEGEANSTVHSAFVKLKLPIRKEPHDIRISKAALEQSDVKCDRNNAISVEVYNAGRDEEDKATISIKNTALGINLASQNIHLTTDPDDDEISHSERFPINVRSNAAPGIYQINVSANWNGIPLNSKQVDLKVINCNGQSSSGNSADGNGTTNNNGDSNSNSGNTANANNNNSANSNSGSGDIQSKNESSTVVVVTPSTGTSGQSAGKINKSSSNSNNELITSKEFSLRKSPYFIPLIAGLNLILFIAIAGITLVLVRKKSKENNNDSEEETQEI